MPEADGVLPGWVYIGRSADLLDGGLALCFRLNKDQDAQNNGFVIRYQGAVHAYVNRCVHLALEMDWQAGRFFDLSGLYLICAVHGALFQPCDGLCINGPCRGRSLQKLTVIEHQGRIYWRPDPTSPC